MKTIFHIGAIVLAILVGAGLLALGYVGTVGLDTKIMYFAEMRKPHVKTVSDLCPLEPGETIEMFYSTDVLSPTTDGNFITDRAIYTYSRAKDLPLNLERIPYQEVRQIDLVRGKSWIDDSVLTVVTKDDVEAVLLLSIEQDRDLEFVSRIRSRVKVE